MADGGERAGLLDRLDHRPSFDDDLADEKDLQLRRIDSVLSLLRSRLRLGRRAFRRHPVHFTALACKWVILYAIIVAIITPICFPSYLRPPQHYRELKARCEAPDAKEGCANLLNEKVFISVSLYDKDGFHAGGQWGRALLQLIHIIGSENVFLSIYENDSGPKGKAALEALETKVPCAHKLVNEAHVSLQDFPNVTMPDGSKRMKRLAYLSEMRNRPLRPLDTFDPDLGLQKYDKILFLNDIAFRPIDAAQLLFSTNVGPNGRTEYLSTCSLDWRNPLLFYDLYAQRDAEGFSNGLPIFPIFSASGQGLSRRDMLAQRDAVRVSSCWSGMVAMQARYVQNMERTLPTPDFQAIGHHVVDPARPTNISAPVRFRFEPELFFDACECCLFLADVSQAARDAGARADHTGVFVNPYVRVAYDWDLLPWLPLVQRWERLFVLPQRALSALLRMPTHNPHRTVRQGEAFQEEVWSLEKNAWEMVPRTARNGMFCGVREMQLIQTSERQGDVNWENTRIPRGQTLYFPT